MKNTRNIFFTISFASLAFGLQAQAVTTFAGSAYFGGGDYLSTPNNNKMDEKYSFPSGLAIDNNAKLYITDQHNIMLLDGNTSRIRAGFLDNSPGTADASGTNAGFYNPRGMVVQSDNKVLIIEETNHCIRRIDAFSTVGNTQPVTTIAGTKGSGGYKDGAYLTAKFNQPYDIVMTSTGIIYISDSYNNMIRKLSGGQVTTVCGQTTAGDNDGVGTAAAFDFPMGIFLLDDNTLLVVDRNNGKIKKVNLTTKAVTTVVSGLEKAQCSDLVVVDGVYYIADNYTIKAWDGTSLTVFAGSNGNSGNVDGTGTAARLGELDLMTYDATNKCIYVADRENNIIKKISINAPPIANFIANNTNVTIGQTVKLSNKSLRYNSLQWTFAPTTYTLLNGSTLTDTVVYVKFDVAGAYQVSLKATNTAGNDTKTTPNYINVSNLGNQAPVVDFAANNTTPTVNSTTVSFTDYSTNAPTSWLWTFSPNTVTFTGGTSASSQFPKVIFNNTGSYNVSLKATNATGNNTATKNAYITVAVNAINQPQIDHQFIVFPSPAQQFVMANHPDGLQYLYLRSSDGKLLQKTSDRMLQISEIPAGFYILEGLTINNAIVRKKIQIVH